MKTDSAGRILPLISMKSEVQKVSRTDVPRGPLLYWLILGKTPIVGSGKAQILSLLPLINKSLRKGHIIKIIITDGRFIMFNLGRKKNQLGLIFKR